MSKMGVVSLFSIAAAAVGVRVGVWARVIPAVSMSCFFCDGRGWAQKGGGQKRTSMLFLCPLAMASGLLLFSRARTRLHAQTTGKHTPGTQTPVPDTRTHAHSPRARLSVRAWAHQIKKREDTRPLSLLSNRGVGVGVPLHSFQHTSRRLLLASCPTPPPPSPRAAAARSRTTTGRGQAVVVEEVAAAGAPAAGQQQQHHQPHHLLLSPPRLSSSCTRPPPS